MNGALGTLLFVGPIAALCVLVALTEPLAEPRRGFVIATVVAFAGREAAVFVVIAGGTTLLALNRGVRGR